MRENRSIGHASPGLKVTAKLQMAIGTSRNAGKLNEQLSDKAIANINFTADARNTQLKYTAAGR